MYVSLRVKSCNEINMKHGFNKNRNLNLNWLSITNIKWYWVIIIRMNKVVFRNDQNSCNVSSRTN